MPREEAIREVTELPSHGGGPVSPPPANAPHRKRPITIRNHKDSVPCLPSSCADNRSPNRPTPRFPELAELRAARANQTVLRRLVQPAAPASRAHLFPSTVMTA